MPAPYSYHTTIASGYTDIVSVTFPYIAKADVHVTINTVLVDDDTLTWTTDSTIQLATNPTTGDVVKVYRDTPKDVLSVDWSSPSVLAEADIEKAFTQLLYIAQEAYDLGILPQQELDAAINYINTALNNAQAALDATNAAKDAATTTMNGLVADAQAAATSAQNSADAAALVAEFDPADYFGVANLFSEITTDPDRATARTNIGAASAADVIATAVRYDAAQSLSGPEKVQARGNIDAFPSTGGTVSGVLTASGRITAQAELVVTNGAIYNYGYSGDINKAINYFRSDGAAYLQYGLSGDYFVFNKHVYSSAGRLWGTNDFSSVGASSMRWIYGGAADEGAFDDTYAEASPYMVSGVGYSVYGSPYVRIHRRYLQYYISGTWYTVGFV